MILTGSILGWLIVISLFLALLNYPIKKINRVTSRLPQTDVRRQLTARLTRFLTGNHRFLALLALLLLIAHLIVQSIVRWVSLSGLIAATLLLVTGLFGGFGHFVRKKKRGDRFYVAVDGLVYDVSALSRWLTGLHMNMHVAGEDLSEAILEAPHSKAILERAKVVGKLAP